MKKTTIAFIILAIFFASKGMSQVTLNFESGNKAIEQGNCWVFNNFTYSNLEFRIAGFWSGRSDKLTSTSINFSYLKTPWMKPGSGNLTMKARLENDGGTTRGIAFSYITYDPNASASNKEGTVTTYHTYYFPKPHNIWIQNISVPIPAAIANSPNPYKIMISFIGTGGTSRAFSDDIVIPGTYFSNPANGCLPLQLFLDADGDGVADNEDAYPNDANRAYNSYFPSLNQSGTLAFEDLWPARGDYDFNDVVVNYRIQTVSNAANNVVELFCKFDLRATGASFHNGFGFQLDGIAPNKIVSISGNSISSSSIYNLASNGTETGQAFATCIVFDDFFKVMNWPGSGSGINTDKNAPFVPYVTLNVHLVLINNGIPATGGTVSNSTLTNGAFNFFIVANQDRGKEIHLADRAPTSLANIALFGTLDDDTNPGSGKYYKTENNLPWGINIIQGFDYPKEKSPINEAYNHFIEWAESAGISYSDWFSNSAGYRNSDKIY